MAGVLRRHLGAVAVAGAAVVACLGFVPAAGAAVAPGPGAAVAPGSHSGAGAPAGVWGNAEEVPGSAALDTGGDATASSVSCPSPGNCSAIGYYEDSGGTWLPFAVNDVNGAWGTAGQIAGAPSGAYRFTSVSCPTPGNCSAAWSYTDGVAASEVNGTWGKAVSMPGLFTVSCGSPGNCSAGGADTAGGFVVDQVRGNWLTPQDLAGTTSIFSVSCTSAGYCSAGGGVRTTQDYGESVVVGETGGSWGTPGPVPGLTALNKGGDSYLTSLSCTSAGNCSAGGYYADINGKQQVYVVSEVKGTWGKAEEVPGTGSLNAGGKAWINSVSCASPGNCDAAGYYTDSAGYLQAFVASQVGGTWGQAQEVAGALNTGGRAEVTSVSCGSPGNCSAGGFYEAGPLDGAPGFEDQAFVVSEVNGTWGQAEEMPGTAALNSGDDAQVTSVSCASPGDCAATGFYTGSAGQHAFVAAEQVPPHQADLNVSLHPRGKFRHGRNATYRVHIHNAGNATASHEKVTVHLPSGISHPHAHGGGWACHSHSRHHGSTVICTHHGHLRPRHSATFTLGIHITARKGAKLTTTARVTPAGSDTNNTATSTVRVR